MIELLDTFPDTTVDAAEYQRLLGYPRERNLEGRALELATWARDWYSKNGRPWIYARQANTVEITNGSILIDNVAFSSKRLNKRLLDAAADSAILVAVSAGPEVEAEAQKLWHEEKPDEYFFLEIFGSAVVEHLTTMMGARLCAWADRKGLAVLPHYSPGYPEWDISQQSQLLQLMQRTHTHALPGQLQCLDSGMLRPKKSLLAVFGVTKHVDRVRKLTDLVPCENCSYASCQYRRVPYHRLADKPSALATQGQARGFSPRSDQIKYAVNAKALKRWTQERLTLTHNPDGTIDALFRFDGNTCTNMGRSFVFHYRVKLSAHNDGHIILDQHCGPAPNDEGHRYMCRFMSNAEHLMVAIDHEKPLLGQKLDDVLTWDRPTVAPSCYCEPASRKHKWGLVLETIHYALTQRVPQPAQLPTAKV
jgi:hypothetical protein